MWSPVYFVLHVAAVYAIAILCVPYVSGWIRGTLLPLLGSKPTASGFEFLFSHLLAFSFGLGFVAGFVNARFRHAAAQFVCAVPLVVLAYKIITFPHAVSVLYGTSVVSAALHHYFDWTFNIAEFRSYEEMFRIASGNPDVPRGLDQLHFTGPFYAGIGYGIASFICMRWKRSLPDVVVAVERWHRSTRLADGQNNRS
jgi:uncharacterized membrane-anchored protein YitT (DUF2179 family)